MGFLLYRKSWRLLAADDIGNLRQKPAFANRLRPNANSAGQKATAER
jgi:hypothetical protein